MKRERGISLPLFLAMLATGGALLTLGKHFSHSAGQRRQSAESQALQDAREALIARAVNDENRPGSLPCPDLTTDDDAWANHPGDGKADMLTRNQCPSLVGWLPWVTLSLPQVRDRHAIPLWYVIAPGLRDDESAAPINSTSATGLATDHESEIAALLIAPGKPISEQQRTIQNPDAYIEGRLYNEGPLHYRSRTDSNDRILAISRSELMAAVEQRVAQSLRSCLLAHGQASGNYPWPAPLNATDFEGRQQTRFGRVPNTRPGPGPAQMLNTLASRIAPNTAEALEDSASILKTTTQAAVALRNFLTTLEASAELLLNDAGTLKGQLDALTRTIASAVSNGRIARSEGVTITAQSSASIATVHRLGRQISRLGFNAPRTDQDAETTGQRVERQAAALTLAATAFQARDMANPRPVQTALVPDVDAIARSVSELQTSNDAILAQLAALPPLSALARTTNNALLDSIAGKAGAMESLHAWMQHPDPGTRATLAARMQKVNDVRASLDEQIDALSTASRSHDASAWPMFWEASECDFLLPDTNRWWAPNRWQDSLFYQISAPEAGQTGQLKVGHRSALSIVVIAAGAPMAGQARNLTSRISDYLEGANASNTRDGDAMQPIADFTQKVIRNTANDQLAY